MRARCAKPMRWHSATSLRPGDPVCGMPEGHAGHCLSQAAWRRKLTANARTDRESRKRRLKTP